MDIRASGAQFLEKGGEVTAFERTGAVGLKKVGLGFAMMCFRDVMIVSNRLAISGVTVVGAAYREDASRPRAILPTESFFTTLWNQFHPPSRLRKHS